MFQKGNKLWDNENSKKYEFKKGYKWEDRFDKEKVKEMKELAKQKIDRCVNNNIENKNKQRKAASEHMKSNNPMKNPDITLKVSKASKGEHRSPNTEFKPKPKIDKTCLNCNRNHEVIVSRINARFCSKKCYNEYRRKNREIYYNNPILKKGHTPWNKDKHHTEEANQKNREKHLGKHNSPKTEFKIGHKESLEIKEKRMKNSIKSLNKHPNKKESFIDSLIQPNFPNQYKLNLPPNITVINGKVPDWININGQKKVINFNGIYWHLKRYLKQNPSLTKELVEAIERKPYEEFGFKLLIIWEDELKNKQLVLEKIKDFIKR